MKKILFIAITAIFCWNSLFSQSTDPDHPTSLTDKQLSVTAADELQSYYFTFMATGGEIKLTGDGQGNSSQFEVEVLDEDFKTIHSYNFFAKTPSNRTINRTIIEQSQKIILKIITPKDSNASFKLRIEGAVSFENITNSNAGTNDNNDQYDENARIIVTLRDGTIKEGFYTEYNIDNSNPKKIVLVIKGNNLPEMQYDDIASIEIFGSNKVASTTDVDEERVIKVKDLTSPIASSSQFLLSNKVAINTLSGNMIKGTYGSYTYKYNVFNAKHTIVLTGKNLPKFTVSDVKSIVIEK